MKSHPVQANALDIPLASGSVQCIVTSPPYFGLRDYSESNQIGLEPTLQEYIANLVSVFDECWRVLRDSGVVFLNLGDTYAGSGGAGGDYKKGGLREGQPRYKSRMKIDKSKRNEKRHGGGDVGNQSGFKPKDLMGVPWRVAFALQDRGWYLRSDIIWHKPNPMPESVTDRPTKSHEYIFLLTKNKNYYYDADAIREPVKEVSLKRAEYGFSTKHPSAGTNGIQVDKMGERFVNPSGRNKRSVWTITTRSYSGAHFATFPPELPEICIKAGTSEKGECPECGNPWERVVERIFHGKQGAITKGRKHISGKEAQWTSGWESVPRGVNEVTTTGWRPTCEHDREPVPQTVLDPFGGSGTTAMVARNLARNLARVGICLDLSMKYLQLAQERLGITALADWQNGGKKAKANWQDTPLFKEVT